MYKKDKDDLLFWGSFALLFAGMWKAVGWLCAKPHRSWIFIAVLAVFTWASPEFDGNWLWERGWVQNIPWGVVVLVLTVLSWVCVFLFKSQHKKKAKMGNVIHAPKD